MRGHCAVTRSLSHALAVHARWLAIGPSGMALALNLPSFDLPPLPVGGASGRSLTPDQIRAYAALYYYAEIEATGLMQVAELLPAERDTMRITDAELYRKLEDLAREMRGEWYSAERRSLLFRAMLGIGEATSIHSALDPFTRTFTEVEGELRRSGGATSFRIQAAVEMASQALLSFMAGRAAMGLERAAAILNRQLRRVIDLLSSPALLSMFRVNSLWALVRQIAVPMPGGRLPDLGRAVTRATSGSTCLAWLAEMAPGTTPPPAVLLAASNWQMNRPEGLSAPYRSVANNPGFTTQPGQTGGGWA